MLKRVLARYRERGTLRRTQALVEHRNLLFGRCPHCGEELGTHPSRDLGCARPSRPDSQLARLEQAAADHDWATVGQVQEFDGTADLVVVHAISWPSTGQSVVFKLLSPFELMADDQVVTRESLSLEETQALRQVFPEPWSSAEAVIRALQASS